jgi:hypothetical protein
MANVGTVYEGCWSGVGTSHELRVEAAEDWFEVTARPDLAKPGEE